jgi:hypothetical protein
LPAGFKRRGARRFRKITCDVRTVLIATRIAYERAIDLQPRYREAFQVRQARIPGTEVVDRQFDAERTYIVHQTILRNSMTMTAAKAMNTQLIENR